MKYHIFVDVSNPLPRLQLSCRTLSNPSYPSNSPSRVEYQWQAERLAKSAWHGREQLDAPFDSHLLVSWRVQNCLLVHLTSWRSLSDRVTWGESERDERVPGTSNKRYCSNPTHFPLPWNITTEVHNNQFKKLPIVIPVFVRSLAFAVSSTAKHLEQVLLWSSSIVLIHLSTQTINSYLAEDRRTSPEIIWTYNLQVLLC